MIPGMEVLFNHIETAMSLNLGDIPVMTPELYLAWHAGQVKSRRIARVWQSDARLVARIEHGRWIVDCPACSTIVSPKAALIHPEWRIACCAECGGIYNSISFPLKPIRLALERLMLFRPRENRNWFPMESIDDIALENIQNGVAA